MIEKLARVVAVSLLAGGMALAQANQLLPAAPPKLTLVVSSGTADSPSGTALRMIYGEAARRVGHELNLVSMPSARATAQSDRGVVDGEINRVADYGDLHPNLIRVDTPHFTVNFNAYGRGDTKMGTGWTALQQQVLRVDYVRGCKKCEAELPRVVPAERLSAVNTVSQALRKLVAARTDLIIDIDSEVDALLQAPEFAAADVKRVALMEAVPMHAYLHKKQATLAPQLSAALLAMKKEGLLNQYLDIAFKRQGKP